MLEGVVSSYLKCCLCLIQTLGVYHWISGKHFVVNIIIPSSFTIWLCGSLNKKEVLVKLSSLVSVELSLGSLFWQLEMFQWTFFAFFRVLHDGGVTHLLTADVPEGVTHLSNLTGPLVSIHGHGFLISMASLIQRWPPSCVTLKMGTET